MGAVWGVVAAPCAVLFTVAYFWVFLKLRRLYPADRDAQASSVGISFLSVHDRREWWRFAAAPLVHVEIFHLITDTWMLWAVSDAERQYGTIYFLSRTLFLVIGVAMGRYALFRAASRYGLSHLLAPLGNTHATVGSTGVLMGWVTLTANDTSLSSLRFAPTLSLAMVQLLVRHASSLDAFLGLLMGWLASLGVFDSTLRSWYWSTWLFSLSALAVAVSVEATTQYHVPGLEVGDSLRQAAEEGRAHTASQDLFWQQQAVLLAGTGSVPANGQGAIAAGDVTPREGGYGSHGIGGGPYGGAQQGLIHGSSDYSDAV
eukprot:g1133.t1